MLRCLSYIFIMIPWCLARITAAIVLSGSWGETRHLSSCFLPSSPSSSVLVAERSPVEESPPSVWHPVRGPLTRGLGFCDAIAIETWVVAAMAVGGVCVHRCVLWQMLQAGGREQVCAAWTSSAWVSASSRCSRRLIFTAKRVSSASTVATWENAHQRCLYSLKNKPGNLNVKTHLHFVICAHVQVKHRQGQTCEH